MPKWNNYQEVRLQILEAYRHFEPVEELETIEGTVLQKTRAILRNIERRKKTACREEWKEYYKIGQLWNEEVEHVWNPGDREVCNRALSSTLSAAHAKIVRRTYQLFRHRPEALDHFYCSLRAVEKLMNREVDELEEEVRQMQRDFFQLGQHIDLE